VADESTDSEHIQTAKILMMDLEDILARLREWVDDMQHDDNVARVERDWSEE